MSRCRALAWTGDPNRLVIRCKLEEHEHGSHIDDPEENMRDCDRCMEPTPATKEVRCYEGCLHMQCEGCAEWTAKEAIEEALS